MENKGKSLHFEGARRRRSASSRKPRLDSHSSHPGSKIWFRSTLFSESADDFSPEKECLAQGPYTHPSSTRLPCALRASESMLEESGSKTSDKYVATRINHMQKSSTPLSGQENALTSKNYLLENEDSEDEWDIEISQHKRKSKSERVLKDLYENEEKGPCPDNAYMGDSDFKIQEATEDSEYSYFSSVRKESTLTARQKALQLSKSLPSKTSRIGFKSPDVTPSSAEKTRENAMNFDQRLKKTDAAQKRRAQAEKVNQRIQKEAIKRILGKHSKKHKKKGKRYREKGELEEGKEVIVNTHASNSVRWVSGPSGTIVSFPDNAEFLGLFNSAPRRYPPAREKCAGPSCNNIYRYRDSKSNLPLCSLICYKAIHNMTPVSTH